MSKFNNLKINHLRFFIYKLKVLRNKNKLTIKKNKLILKLNLNLSLFINKFIKNKTLKKTSFNKIFFNL